MNILERWNESHHEIHTKISLLEKALINFLDNTLSDKNKQDMQTKLGFLESFESGLEMHFAIEEKALFPEGKPYHRFL